MNQALTAFSSNTRKKILTVDVYHDYPFILYLVVVQDDEVTSLL